MHRLLYRQLKRFLGVDDPAQVQPLLDDLLLLAARPDVAPATSVALAGLGGLMQAVQAAYEQSDRDLGLRARSLELSSSELAEANQRLRRDLVTCETFWQVTATGDEDVIIARAPTQAAAFPPELSYLSRVGLH